MKNQKIKKNVFKKTKQKTKFPEAAKMKSINSIDHSPSNDITIVLKIKSKRLLSKKLKTNWNWNNSFWKENKPKQQFKRKFKEIQK